MPGPCLDRYADESGTVPTLEDFIVEKTDTKI